MKTKILILFCAVAIIAAHTGCSFFYVPTNDGKGCLRITIGLFDASRTNYTPVFSLSAFEKIILTVSTGGTTVTDISLDPRVNSMVIELLDVPYDTYTISARAYSRASHTGDDYAAWGVMEYKFTRTSTWVTVTMDPVIGEEGTTGTLYYKLINVIGLPIQAELYPFDDLSGESCIILTQGINPVDPVSGYYSLTLDSGFYYFFFGENPPGIVHIYKNMDTVLEEEFTIYGSVSTIVNSPVDTNVKILLSCNGIPVNEGDILSYGSEVKITIVNGEKYRYTPGSLMLNNGNDNMWFFTPELKNPDKSFTRTFRMPSRNVVVSVQAEPIAGADIDFFDPNMAAQLLLWSLTDGSGIDSVSPGQKITVVFTYSEELDLPFAIQSWWLDDKLQINTGDPTNQTFTVPSPCTAWSVTVIATIGNVPHSVSIPIGHN